MLYFPCLLASYSMDSTSSGIDLAAKATMVVILHNGMLRYEYIGTYT